MATTVAHLTVKEFERQFAEVKPNHEFWFGEAVAKAAATWTHGATQAIVGHFLMKAGFKTAVELTLKVRPDFLPVADVVATRGRMEQPCPTRAAEVVTEILSPEDGFQRVVRKCRLYAQWGVPSIFVIDPDEREAWEWNATEDRLDHVTQLALGEGASIALSDVFAGLDLALSQ